MEPIDKQLASILVGDYPMPTELEDRVVLLVSLAHLYNTTLACGWHRHTNDWDFEVHYVTDERTYISHNEPWEVLFDTPSPTACVDFLQATGIKFSIAINDEEDNWVMDDEVTLPIARLKLIHIEEA